MITIYKITNPIGQAYIGQTSNFRNRIYNHRNRAILDFPHTKIEQSYLTFGFKNHIIEILETCSHEIKNAREQFWIEKYNSFENGLNATFGGSIGYTNRKYFYAIAEDGLIIGRYKLLKDASSATGVVTETISKVLAKKKYHGKKLLFCYCDEYKEGMKYVKKPIDYSYLNKRQGKGKIYQIDCDNNVTREFKHIGEAAKLLGIYPSEIGKVVRGLKNSYNGFRFLKRQHTNNLN